MSERALVYDEEPLAHRMLVIYEAAGAEAETASYLIRSLLSEGHVRYVTTEKTPTGLASRRIEREGPTGLVTTTTRTRLHGENETRLLSISVTNTVEQTKAVMLALASESARRGAFQQWHAFQEWLASGPADVTIPYAFALATLTEPLAVRLRRDFAAVLELIRAHALLHQANREHTPNGLVVATIDN